MSNTLANKALVQRYFELFNDNRLDAIDEVLAQDYGDKLEGQTAGIEVVRAYLQGLKASFPDFTWTIERIIAEGDLVAVMNRVSGTHRHRFGGMEPTGARVDFAAFQFYRVAGGRIQEHWEVADFAKFQQQLGASQPQSAFKAFQAELPQA